MMSRVTRKEWYRRVNAAWPEVVPTLTPEEAVRAARKLYRYAMKQSFSGDVRVTSGNRYTWIRRGVMSVNPDNPTRPAYHRGIKGIVHDLSHYCHYRVKADGVMPHSGDHARMELRMIKAVLRRGFLDGALKDKPKERKVAPDMKVVKLLRTESAIQRWESKLKRAQTALKKLRRKQAYYSRATQQSNTTVH